RYIDSDTHLFERHSARETRFRKFHIAAQRVIDARGASDFVGSRPDGIDLTGENELLDFFFNLIVQLVTVVPEKFDTVVLIRVMRSGKNDASVGTQRARNVSNAGRRQRSD